MRRRLLRLLPVAVMYVRASGLRLSRGSAAFRLFCAGMDALDRLGARVAGWRA